MRTRRRRDVVLIGPVTSNWLRRGRPDQRDDVTVHVVAFSDEYVRITVPPADVKLFGLSESVAVGTAVHWA